MKQEKVIHALSLEYARAEAAKEYSTDTPLGKLEYHEKLVCLYDWCFNNLMKNYQIILDDYNQSIKEFHQR